MDENIDERKLLHEVAIRYLEDPNFHDKVHRAAKLALMSSFEPLTPLSAARTAVAISLILEEHDE